MHLNTDLDKKLKSPTVAYFSMEIGIIDEMKTYAGGLGILAGDTLKSASDLELEMVGITLLYRNGYFKQLIKEDGEQIEVADEWDYMKYLKNTGKKVSFQMKNETISAEILKYDLTGISGHTVPIYFLNTDIEENSQEARYVSFNLYTPYEYTRMLQEITLGLGGVLALTELGYKPFDNYHLNESHAVFGVPALEKMFGGKEEAKKRIIFTTHTPTEHGHKIYSRETLQNILNEEEFNSLASDIEEDKFHTTKYCLKHSKYRNAVSKRHGEVSNEMFKGYDIDFITNGVHANSWVGTANKKLYDKYIPGWEKDPGILKLAANIPIEEIERAHLINKTELLEFIKARNNVNIDVSTFTIGFARRVDGYKRSRLIFENLEKLQEIAEKFGGLEIIFSGKAYFDYGPSEEKVAEIFKYSRQDLGKLHIVYLEDYGIEVSKKMIEGCDLWLNNPIKPLEASGTSGMKAALNGIPSFSTIDGWWYEGLEEGVTGWAIGNDDPKDNDEEKELIDLYGKLENIILPMYHEDTRKWGEIQRNAISKNASHFHTHRMLREYIEKAYSI